MSTFRISSITVTITLLFAMAVVGCGGSANSPADATGPTGDAAAPHRCDLADCQDGLARTCDSAPLSLDCQSFGATCSDFVDPDQTPFSWCGCGPIAEGQGQCLDGRNGVTCQSGLGAPAQCAVGTRCVVSPTDQFGLACTCDDLTDGVCPDPACTDDPDCMHCTPDCSGKQCGDNGCGGQCGSCALGDSCNAGTCTHICVPDCSGKQCGDDGCGGSCGTCDGTCTATQQCAGTCVPSCTNKVCGGDGCTGSCGTCSGGLSCELDGTCGCGFFDVLHYVFTLDPAATWPPAFSFVGLNLQHIDLDGTQNPNNTNGAFLRLQPASDATFTFSVYGCRPDIVVKRDYALSGITCHGEQTITGRSNFVLSPPIVNADGSCTVVDL